MMTWSPRANDLLLKALQLRSDDERQEYLDRTCAGNAALRAEVESLLEASVRAGSFLESPVLAPHLVRTVDEQPISERPGTVIGPYKLMEQIGEGGMGLVFVAEQLQPVRRKVALKVIKPGMDTCYVVARFEAERQALALMDHPHIAHVFDGGETASGRPYFVMELVRGVPITDFCDRDRLSIHARLGLFRDVCQAVQHAHQKGIIHRDLKPSNVMVTLHDGAPVVKVIDFGIAKTTGQQLTNKTLHTGFAQMVGTPLYMSPEQAGLSGLDVDTRSDIYSLGVLLYELLTGTTPFDKERLREADYDEIRRIIREVEPARPSTRISTMGQAASTISTQRQSEPKQLRQLFRGELDWIVMKALDKDRNRRYETASAFAADVQRYLHDEPVLACPPSAWYRFRKFARRNKRAALMAGLLVLLLVGAVAVLGVSYAQVQEALQDKTRAFDREQQTIYLQQIALAGRELAAGNVGHAEELLDDCPEHLRGWEWHFLKRQRYGNAPPLQHSTTVVRVAFSPDGRQLASICMDGRFRIWDARTGRILHTLERQTVFVRVSTAAGLCRGMAYSPDSRYLALARHDGVVQVWDAESGKLRHAFKGHKGPAWQAAFSPDSRTLASGGSDRCVRLWDVAGGQALQVLAEHPAAVKGVAFRPDGRSVVAACDDGTVKVWDRNTERETFSFHGELVAYPYSAFFSPDARRLAWSCLGGVVKIWDTTTGRLEIDQQTNLHQCRAVSFSPDGKRLALAGFDGTLRILEAITGREMQTIFAHPYVVADAAFSPDGNKIASASYDHTIRIWDATPLDGDPLAGHCVTLTGLTQLVSGVAFSADGRWLAASSADGTVKLWETRALGAPGEFALRYTLRGHGGHVVGVAFSSDNRTLASASWDMTVKLWDPQAPAGDSLTELRTIRCAGRVTSLALSPDGRRLAAGQNNGIALYDPASGREVAPFKPTPAPVPAMAFSSDSRHLVSAGASDPAIKVWDVDAQKPLLEIRQDPAPNSAIAISPDSRLIATSGSVQEAAAGPTVKIWKVDLDAKTYTDFRTLKGHVRYVWRVAFSPDGRYLATGSWDSTIKIWDLQSPESAEPVTLPGHAGMIYGLAFSPDGRRLAAASGSPRRGEVKVWDAALWDNKASGRKR